MEKGKLNQLMFLVAKTNCMISKYLIENYDVEIPDEYYTEFLLSKITEAYIQ